MVARSGDGEQPLSPSKLAALDDGVDPSALLNGGLADVAADNGEEPPAAHAPAPAASDAPKTCPPTVLPESPPADNSLNPGADRGCDAGASTAVDVPEGRNRGGEAGARAAQQVAAAASHPRGSPFGSYPPDMLEVGGPINSPELMGTRNCSGAAFVKCI